MSMLLEFIVIYGMSWIVTTAATYGIIIKSELDMYKWIADEGYKLDMTRMREIAKNTSPEMDKKIKVGINLPGINLACAFSIKVAIMAKKDMIVDQYKAFNFIEKMSTNEEEFYKKNPSGVRAALFEPLMKIRLSKSEKIAINSDYGEAIFYIEKDKETGKINILKAAGVAENMSLDKQYEILNSVHKKENVQLQETVKNDSGLVSNTKTRNSEIESLELMKEQLLEMNFQDLTNDKSEDELENDGIHKRLR